MAIKVVDSTVNAGELSATLEIDAPNDTKEQIGEYLVEQILAATAESKSPVAGYGKFPALSAKYKEKKEESGRSGVPNLDYEGDMLGELNYEITDEGIKIGIFGEQAPKADGHNNFSGESQLPLRRFIPDVGEDFNKSISFEIEAILAESAVADVVNDLPIDEITAELETVETKSDFFSVLTDLTGIEDERALKNAVLTSPKLLSKVKELGLARYLK